MRTYEPFGGRFFVQPLRIERGTNVVSRSHTWETDGQYRFSPTTWVLRLPLGRGLGFGWWQDSDVENFAEEREARKRQEREDAEYDTYCVVNGKVDRDEWEYTRAQARGIIAHQGLDPDDEMEIMQSLGLMG